MLHSLVAFIVEFALCAADWHHCARIAWTAGGPRCVEVTLVPTCEAESGWHWILFTPVCTRDCEGGGPTT